MLQFPQINPIALHLGPLSIHWYGLMYLIGFAGGWGLLYSRAKRSNGIWTPEQISDIVFYVALGVILGGRIGYMIFYNLPTFMLHPLELFKIWHGGMSFHGGLLGVLAAMWLFSRKHKKSFISLTDFIAPVVPIGLGAGRIGNFINGELFGRVTDVPWAIVYPHAGPLPRHPSEIYEFLLEGALLFMILWFYSAKPKPRAAVSGMFSLCYGIFRCIGECFRQPDPQYGYVAFGWLTMGQILSIPMILLGTYLLYYAYKTTHEK